MAKRKSQASVRKTRKQRGFQFKFGPIKFDPKTLKRGSLAAGIVLVLLAGYIVEARAAVNGYKQRLATGEFSFSGNIMFVGQDFLSPLNSDMAFQGNYDGSNPPQHNAHFSGNWGNRAYTGDAEVADRRLYFALSGPDMPVIRYRQGSYLLPLEAGREYSAKIDESLYDNICAHNQPASLQGELELYRTIKGLKLSASPWVNFWAASDGQAATHLSATLSGRQLAGLWTALQHAAPPGCGDPNTIGFTSDDLKHVSTHIDLFAGHDQDQVKITLNDKTLGAKASLTLNTFNYGHVLPKPAPAGATDINAIYSRFGAR